MLETWFREKNIYTSPPLECSKILETRRSVPNYYSRPRLPSFNLSASFHFILPFLPHATPFRGDNAANFSRFDSLVSDFTVTPIFSSELSNSEETSPEDFGLRFCPTQVSMDTTKRIARIQLPLHFASFQFAGSCPTQNLVTPTRSDHHRKFAVANNVRKGSRDQLPACTS